MNNMSVVEPTGKKNDIIKKEKDGKVPSEFIRKYRILQKDQLADIECYKDIRVKVTDFFRDPDSNNILRNILKTTNMFDLNKEIIKLFYKPKNIYENNIHYICIPDYHEYRVVTQYKSRENPNPNPKFLKLAEYKRDLRTDVEDMLKLTYEYILYRINNNTLKLKKTDKLIISKFIDIFTHIKIEDSHVHTPHIDLLLRYNKHHFYDMNEGFVGTQRVFAEFEYYNTSMEKIVRNFRYNIEETFRKVVTLYL